MQQYYNKLVCNAASVLKMMRKHDDVYIFILDDGQEYEAYNGADDFHVKVKLIGSQLLHTLIHKEVDDPHIYEMPVGDPIIIPGTKFVELPRNEWIIPPMTIFLVERFDLETDAMRVALVEERIFKSNFYLDEPKNLIEMHSFEEPVHYRS
jgi:hypothetical protein